MENTNIFLNETTKGESSVLIVDESLETKTASSCDLLVALESDNIQLALREKKSNRILALESFSKPNSRQENNWTAALEQVSKNSHLLRNYEFTRAIVGLFNNSYTLVPDALFRAGDEPKYFNFNIGKSTARQKVIARHVDVFQLKTIFAVSEELHHEIFHLFENPELIHISSSLLEAAQLQSRGKKEKELFINIRKNDIDIIVLEGKKLLLQNTYNAQTADDCLYFTLMVCDQLELDPDNIQAKIAGEIEKESAKYKLLYSYFRNIQFSARPGNVKFSYRFDQLASHNYFSLFSLALCES